MEINFFNAKKTVCIRYKFCIYMNQGLSILCHFLLISLKNQYVSFLTNHGLVKLSSPYIHNVTDHYTCKPAAIPQRSSHVHVYPGNLRDFAESPCLVYGFSETTFGHWQNGNSVCNDTVLVELGIGDACRFIRQSCRSKQFSIINSGIDPILQNLTWTIFNRRQ